MPETVDNDFAETLFGTAAEHASQRVPLAEAWDSAAATLSRMDGKVFDSAALCAVLEGGKLAGLVTIEQLLAGSPHTPVADLMDAQPAVVTPGTHQERAAYAAVRHGKPGVAVVDASGRFYGLIAPRTLLEVVFVEHDEDMARVGGYLASTRAARTASTEPILQRFAHRMPWLLVGLLGALLAAGVVSAFEQQLRSEVLIAFFVPGVVYIADAVGNQTTTLVVRGLSLGIGVRRVVARELFTGALLGVVLAVLALAAVWLVWGHGEVATAVAVAVFAACAIASVIAMLLPWLIQRLGRDPAFGAGPMATVIQDLLSVTVYFGAAALIVF